MVRTYFSRSNNFHFNFTLKLGKFYFEPHISGTRLWYFPAAMPPSCSDLGSCRWDLILRGFEFSQETPCLWAGNCQRSEESWCSSDCLIVKAKTPQSLATSETAAPTTQRHVTQHSDLQGVFTQYHLLNPLGPNGYYTYHQV